MPIKFETEHLPIINKPFTGRDEYLTWRSAWRAHYAALSTTIKKLKRLRKTGLNYWNYESKARPALEQITNEALKKIGQEMFDQFSFKMANELHWPGADALTHYLGKEATALLLVRKQSKLEAQHQYSEAHPPTVVVNLS